MARLLFAVAMLSFGAAGARAQTTTTTLPPCTGTAKQAIKCDAAETKKALCMPCQGAKLKGCNGKVAGPLRQAQQAADGALKAKGKGNTQKADADLNKAQQGLTTAEMAIDKLIDKKANGSQACKDAAHQLLKDLGVELAQEATGGTTTTSTVTTTTTSTPTSTTTSTTAAVRGCSTVHVDFFYMGCPGLETIFSIPSGISCGSTCMADFGPSTSTVDLFAAVGPAPVPQSFSGDCTSNGVMDLSRATQPDCILSCMCF